jgi:heme exporter protein C
MFLLLPAIPIALYFAFLYAPTEQVMGEVQRIFYFHVSSAWISLLSFFFVFVGGVLYLWKKKPVYDRFAYAAVELGVLFCTIVLVTGPIWAKPVWNVWWTWDPRLTSTFVLWLIFVAYLLFRASLRHHPSVRTYASVYGIIGFVDVPIVWMSIRWWRTIHPKVISPEKIDMDPKMWTAVLISFLALLLLYTILMISRMRLERFRELVDSFQERLVEIRN